MKRYFTIPAAFAASMFVYAASANADSFSGITVGLGIGYDNYNVEIKDGGDTLIDGLGGQGATGEITIGWGGRSGAIVYGVDVFANNSGAEVSAFNDEVKVEAEMTYGLSGKLGWAASSNTAIYGKASLLRSKFKYSEPGFSNSETLDGLGLGLGMETKVAENISVALDWTHVWYEDYNFFDTGTAEATRDTVMARLIFGF